MHRIRLRDPWTVGLNTDATQIIYSRKFHKPTGVDDQSLTLKLSLFPPEDVSEVLVSVSVNGNDLSARALFDTERVEHAQFFQLDNLQAFNTVELRITGATPTTGSSKLTWDPTAIPKFGSFVIESAELQIE